MKARGVKEKLTNRFIVELLGDLASRRQVGLRERRSCVLMRRQCACPFYTGRPLGHLMIQYVRPIELTIKIGHKINYSSEMFLRRRWRRKKKGRQVDWKRKGESESTSSHTFSFSTLNTFHISLLFALLLLLLRVFFFFFVCFTWLSSSVSLKHALWVTDPGDGCTFT